MPKLNENKPIANKLKQFDEFHSTAMKYIREALVEDGEWNDIRGIVTWMLSTDANPYGYLPEPWAAKFK